MIFRCETVPGPCDFCGRTTSALRCVECAYPKAQRPHPKQCKACRGWSCGVTYTCRASVVQASFLAPTAKAA